jgi:hypothetical protein
MVGLVLVVCLGRALAQEDANIREEPGAQEAARAYDEAIVRFNTNIKNFSSWAAFKAEVFARVLPGTIGKCYESTGNAMQPVQVTTIPLPREEDAGWQKTSDKGWRQYKEDRTFVEYRVNDKAGVLLRVEGVKPRFFFSYTRRICEFPLG